MDSQMGLLDQKGIQFPLKVHQRKEKEIEVSFHRCKTSKQIIYLWYGLHGRVSVNTVVDLTPFMEDGTKTGPISKAIKAAEKHKKWGFCKRPGKNLLGGKIFFWVSDKADILDMIFVLAHEIAHTAGCKSENSANKVAAISSFAVHVASRFSKGKIKLK